MTVDEIYTKCKHVYRFDIVPPTSTAQQSGVNFKTGKRFFKPQASAAKETLLTVLMTRQPNEPLLGALEMHVIAVWPLTKGDEGTKAKVAALARSGWTIRSKSKPDNDNFLKFLQDVLKTTGYIKDDSQISDTHVYKRRGKHPCLIIGFNEVPEYFEGEASDLCASGGLF